MQPIRTKQLLLTNKDNQKRSEWAERGKAAAKRRQRQQKKKQKIFLKRAKKVEMRRIEKLNAARGLLLKCESNEDDTGEHLPLVKEQLAQDMNAFSDPSVSSVSSVSTDPTSSEQDSDSSQVANEDTVKEDLLGSKNIEYDMHQNIAHNSASNTANKHADYGNIEDIDEDIDDMDGFVDEHLPQHKVTGHAADTNNKDVTSSSDQMQRWKSLNHYTVLRVVSDFTEKELKRAYRKVSRVVHPDKNGGSTAAFQRVADAYKTLQNPEKRAAYDMGEDIKLKEFEAKISKRKAKQTRRLQLLEDRHRLLLQTRSHDLYRGISDAWDIGSYNLLGGSYNGSSRGRGMELFSEEDSRDSENDEDAKDSEQEEEEAKHSLQEDIQRKYFPEHFPWEPFGDPHESRRRR